MGDSVSDDRAGLGISGGKDKGLGLFLIPTRWQKGLYAGDEGRWRLEMAPGRTVFLSDRQAKDLSVNDKVLLQEAEEWRGEPVDEDEVQKRLDTLALSGDFVPEDRARPIGNWGLTVDDIRGLRRVLWTAGLALVPTQKDLPPLEEMTSDPDDEGRLERRLGERSDSVSIEVQVKPWGGETGIFQVTWPSGWSSNHDRQWLAERGLPVPEKTYQVTVELTEAELKARRTFPAIPPGLSESGNLLAVGMRKFNQACSDVRKGL